MSNEKLVAVMGLAASLGLGYPLLGMAQASDEAQSEEDIMSIIEGDQGGTPQAATAAAAPSETDATQVGSDNSSAAAPTQDTQTATQADLLDVIPVHSKTAGQDTQAQPHQRSAAPIEEIVVTATKRDTSLMETGIAISVLDSEQMKFQDMSSLEDMQKAVPGLTVGTVMGTPLITIRGVGLNLISGLGNPGVATHYDGIYLPRTGSAPLSSVDMDHVEILRGPQGTLYGRNATGGSVNFMTRRPAQEFGAGLTVGGGDYARRFYEAYVEGPVLRDDLAMRAYFKAERFDGYGVNETNSHSIGGNDALMGRLAFTYQPTDAVDIHGSYARRDDEGVFPYSTALTGVRSLGGVDFPMDHQSFKPFNMKALRDPSGDKTTDVGNLTVTWRPGDYTLKSISGYVGHQRNEDASAPEIERFVVYIFRHDFSEALSQEFNLSSNWFDGRLNWLVGTYYTVDKGGSPFGAFINFDEFFAQNSSTGQVLVFSPTSNTKDTSAAVFLDGSWSALDNLRVIFGMRASQDGRALDITFKPYFEDRTTGNPVTPTATNAILASNLVLQTCDHERHSRDFSSRDPKLGVEWDVAEGTLAYLQYQTGFKAGGFNTTNTCNQTYEPERIKAYEVGLKTTQLDGSLVFKAAVFHYQYSNYQVEKVEGFGSVIDNAAEASSLGAEIEVNFTPVDWLSLDAQYAYLDASYGSYMARDNFNNTTVFTADAPMEDLSGHRLSRSPENSLNLGATLTAAVDRFGLGLAHFRIDGSYTDDVYFREFNRPIEMQQAYSIYNAFLSLDSADEKFSLSLFAKNIGDERYQVGQISFDSVYYRGAYYGPPRTLGASFSLKF